MQRLMSEMRAAIDKYNMIDDGDRICVGVSGGKDSVALLVALCEMRRFYPKSFEICALSINMNFGGYKTNFAPIEDVAEKYGIEYKIKYTQIGEIVFDVRQEKNPCSLCARMRRGALHDAAKEMGCNKIALGHHLDDAVETFFMNIFHGGTIGSFSPVTYLSRKDITMIRPMIYATEKDVIRAVGDFSLPVVKSTCPHDDKGQRKQTKELIKALERDYENLRGKVISALEKGEISGWRSNTEK